MPSLSTRPSRAAPPGNGESYWGLAASTVLHLTAIAALSGLLVPLRQPPSGAIVRTEWSPDPSQTSPLETSLELPALPAADTGGRTAPLVAAHVPPWSPRLFDVRTSHVLGRDSESLALAEAVRAPAGGGRGQGIGVGEGNGAGAGGSGSAFFATDKPNGNYVFVVDCSRSMNHPYPGPAKSRLGRVKVELWKTIYQMAPEQKYFVVFFNTRAIPMPADRMIAGGPEDQTAYLQWTARVRADGETDPREALLLAVRMRPDVIYFLTDGEFNYRVVREASEANFAGVQIHTISLGDDAGGRFLQEIADRNQGQYRHIVQEEDHYWEGAAELPGAASVTSEPRPR